MADEKNQQGSITSDLYALLDSGEAADVVLVVGDCEISTHSQILRARSPVLAAMLRNNMKEARSRRIEIADVREPVLRQLLSFIYKDEAPELESMAAELLAAADKYNLPLLRQKCEQQLVWDLNVENAADTAGLAVLHNCPELKMAAVQFIAGHPEVLATAGWKKLVRENAEAVVEVSEQLAAKLPRAPADRKILSNKLVSAAEKGETGEVASILEAGAPVDVKDDRGLTALHRAVQNGHAGAVKCLVDAGADVDAADNLGFTPLQIAARKDLQNIIWMLIEASAHVDVQHSVTGETALHWAARAGKVASTEALLLAGARRDIRDRDGKTPADLAHKDTKPLFSTHVFFSH